MGQVAHQRQPVRQRKHRRVATVGVLGAAAAGSRYHGALHRKGYCIEGSRRSVATGQMMAGAAGQPMPGSAAQGGQAPG